MLSSRAASLARKRHEYATSFFFLCQKALRIKVQTWSITDKPLGLGYRVRFSVPSVVTWTFTSHFTS
jgi:hypothetical protein